MRSHLVMIKEAELLCRTPEGVFEWLKEHAARSTPYSNELDASADLALLGRNEPLIDLALAKFTRNPETAEALMKKTKDRGLLDFKARGVRLAVLSNEYVGLRMHAIPGALFGDHYEGAIEFLSTADEGELRAMFGNPTLDENFIEDFLSLKSPWTALDEKKQFVAAMALANNPRMRKEYDGPMDGMAEYSHNKVFGAAWNLAETAPVERRWANFLAYLLDGMPSSWSQKDPIPILARWQTPVDETDTTGIVDVKDVAKSGYLGIYQMVRQTIAQAAHNSAALKLSEMLVSEDPAIRAAAYAKGRMTPEQITAAYELDKNLAVNTMQTNIFLWRFDATRQALRRASWDISEFNSNYLDSANSYDHWEEKHKKENPDWFNNEGHSDPEDIAPHEHYPPVSEHPTYSETLPGIAQSVAEISKRLSWVMWGVIGLVIWAFAKH